MRRVAGFEHEGREVQASRPSLGAFDQVAELDLAELEVRLLEQQLGLGGIHRQVLDAEVEHVTAHVFTTHAQR